MLSLLTNGLNMKEIQKPVRRSSLVMLSLFAAAAAGGGVSRLLQYNFSKGRACPDRL